MPPRVVRALARRGQRTWRPHVAARRDCPTAPAVTLEQRFTVVNQLPTPLVEHEVQIRVRYQETDAQGRVHHATYINYFEVGRVEMLRASGRSYRQMEADGVRLVVVEAHCCYYKPAEYDDLLRLVTRLEHSRGVRVRHGYQVFRGDELLADGYTVVASVDPDGRVIRLPDWLRLSPGRARTDKQC
jgi:acyl-CoA thioester hydrolase